MELGVLIPRFFSENSSDQFSKIFDIYNEDLLNSKAVVATEFSMWKNKWNNVEQAKLPATAIDSLAVCDKCWFPNIHVLLRILCVLPVSTCTPERSFSTLRRLKTWIRSTMSEKRLSALAMVNINSNVDISANEVLDVLSRQSRRMDIIL